MRGWLLFLIFTLWPALAGLQAQATAIPVAYLIPQSVYTQNFDGLPSGGSFGLSGKGPFNLSAAPVNGTSLTGWQGLMTAGSAANAGFVVGTGSSTTNGLYTLGTTGSTDRALGSLSASAGLYAFGLILTNQTGAPLNYFTLSFTAEQWRRGGSGNRNTWSFRYKTGAMDHIDQQNLVPETRLNFYTTNNATSASALVGNLPENQQFVSCTVTGIHWKPGEQLLLRWDDADETGSDDIMALDNLSFSAGLMSQPPTVTALAASAVSTNTARLNASVADNFATTAVSFEYDTSILFTTPQTLTAVPDTISPGVGNTAVSATVMGLAPGTNYFFRARAGNSIGTVTGEIKPFTTLFILPVVTTLSATQVLTSSAVVTGKVTGDAITERGIVWSTSIDPTIQHNKIPAQESTEEFTKHLSGLPQGSVVYARAYAVNPGGIVYGDAIRMATQTTIQSLLPSPNVRTNAGSVNFVLRMAQPIAGLSTANFALDTAGISNAAITSITGSNTVFTITVQTGSGNGTVGLRFENDAGLPIPVYNKPFPATGYFSIDKIAPVPRSFTLPDQPVKIGDTVILSLLAEADTDVFKISNCNVNGIPSYTWTRLNDSVYQSYFVAPAGGNDVIADADITYSLTLTDGLGNARVYNGVVRQSNDAMDLNKPSIRSAQNPQKGTYKTGDTLCFIYRFSEPVILQGSGFPSLGLTMGSRSRSATYVSGNGTDSMVFRYIVAADDLAPDGIKIAQSISQSNVQLTDHAGNPASVNFANPLQAREILIDAVAPTVSSIQLPAAKTYRAGDSLAFVFTFSKALVLPAQPGTVNLKLTIGNVDRDVSLVKSLVDNQLIATYIVRPGDLDKNGVSIGTALYITGAPPTDGVGNSIATVYKAGSLANVKIDAVSPVFVSAATEQFFACANSSGVLISNAFAVTDEEAGELVTWRIRNTPVLGTISLVTATANSNGKSILPAGFVYRPNPGSIGTDSIVTEITDGINTTQKTVVIVTHPAISQNTITGSQLVCEGSVPRTITGSVPAGGNESYRYRWESSIDSTRFSIVTGEQRDYLSPPVRNTTWIRRIVLSGACADTSIPVKINVQKSGYWTGAQNTSWHNPANWCGGQVPVSNTNVFIAVDALYQPEITDTGWCNQLVMEQGSRLVIKGVLALSAQITAPASAIDAREGTLFCMGTNPQNIEGSRFRENALKNLFAENGAGVSLDQSLMCSGTIRLTKGTLYTNGKLVLKHDAAIGPCANGTSVEGDVCIERKILKNNTSWIAHPFSHSLPLQMLADGIAVASDNEQHGSPSSLIIPTVSYYNAADGSDSAGMTAGWKTFALTNGTGEHEWKKYETIQLTADSLTTATDTSPATATGSNFSFVRLSGGINTGEQEVLLQPGAHPGYRVTGNVYPAPIEMARITKGKGISEAFWTWNPQQGKKGGYTSIPFNSGYVLPVMGAFAIKVIDSTDNTLLFTEQCKTNLGFDPFPVFDSDDLFFVELRLESGSLFYDRWLLLANDAARTYFDRADAEKILNPGSNLYSLSRDNRQLSIDARPVTNEAVIQLGLQAVDTSAFTIRIANTIMPAANTLMLHDKYLDQWIALEKGNSYSFEITDDTATSSTQRFEIRSKTKNADSMITTNRFTMTVFPVPATNTILVRYRAAETASTFISISDLSGRVIKNISLGQQQQGQVLIPIENFLPGIYIVHAVCGKEKAVQKIIKQ